jgi:hypothetical protein
VGNVRLFLAESEPKMIIQEGFDFLFDVLGERMASPYSNNPIVGILIALRSFDSSESTSFD